MMRLGALLLLVCGLSACATVPALVPQSLLDARAALEAAKKSSADQLAPDDYQTAVKHLQAAEQALAAEREVPVVEDLAGDAQTEAQVAEAVARGRAAQREYETVQQSILTRQTAFLAVKQKKISLSDDDTLSKNAGGDGLKPENSTKIRQAVQSSQLRQQEREQEFLQKARLLMNVTTKTEPRGVVMTLAAKTFFDPASSRLQAHNLVTLDRIAALIKEYPGMPVRVEGYTDAGADPLSNNMLSQARAESIVNYLTQQGVTLDRLTAVGLGSARPVSGNTTAAGRQANQRMEIIFGKALIP